VLCYVSRTLGGQNVKKNAYALISAGAVVTAVVALAGIPFASASTPPAEAGTSSLHSSTSLLSGSDWPAYLYGASHSSYNAADTALTPRNATSIVRKWHWVGDAPTMPGQPKPSLYASPVVADGFVYIGAKNGYFYQLNEATGAVVNKVFLGFVPKLTCNAQGIISTATVAVDPVDGMDTVYVAAPDGYLHALDARDLSEKWRSVINIPSSTVNDYFQWSSPTVANGRIYVGSASQCDQPLTRGALVSFDQLTGHELGRFFTVPDGYLGGGIWTSAAVADDGTVYVSTGTPPRRTITTNRFDSVSIVKLDGTTLQKLGKFTVPDANLCGDCDFGGSPTVFGSMVGACNKNGIYYALDRATMSVAWQRQIGVKSGAQAQCSAAAIYDGTSLYMGGNPTTIKGVAYRGSVRSLDPATGAIQWEVGLPNAVMGSPTMNGGGLIAVGTYDSSATPNAVYLVDDSSGAILKTVNSGGRTFGQPVFANGYLFTANVALHLNAYHLR
jgi:polyvinyl alcohol dehydrogenase (cytochrome)